MAGPAKGGPRHAMEQGAARRPDEVRVRAIIKMQFFATSSNNWDMTSGVVCSLVGVCCVQAPDSEEELGSVTASCQR